MGIYIFHWKHSNVTGFITHRFKTMSTHSIVAVNSQEVKGS